MVEADLHDVLHMVASFLKEQGLHRTTATLIEEARLPDLAESATAGENLETAILEGQWPKVLTMIGQHTFNDSNEVYEAIYAHLIMEMVSAGEKHLARIILDEQKDLLVPNWYQDLWAILYEGKKPFTLEKLAEDEAMPNLDDPILLNSRKMLAKLARTKLITVRPPSDKLIDLVLLARAK